MRLEGALAVALLAGILVAGCLSTGEDLDPTNTSEAEDPAASEPSDEGGAGNETGSEDATDDEAPGNETDGESGDAPSKEPLREPPMAVVAHIDTGVNPYHQAFRDTSELAHTHPSEYIEGFPEDAQALNLSLDAPSYDQALSQDEDVWANVSDDQLYWIPGTRIIGAISFEPGGSRGGVEETQILDDHGHGTMTGSRAVGQTTSLAPDARLVTIEGLGAEQVRWAAEAGWIDVQTNSWITFVPPPVNRVQDDIPAAGTPSTSEAFAEAADSMVTIAASGNGLAYTQGIAPMPTYSLATAPDGVTLVGGHDNGYLAPWSGSPPHLVADGFRPMAAVFDSMTEVRSHGYSCCTSASAPYAAGAYAQAITEARRMLGDRTVGIEEGVVAEGSEDRVTAGPLEDGELTRDELQEVVFHTAQQPPLATLHDGATHWASQPGATPEDPTEPGANAYCAGCWSTPIRYQDIPEDVPTYLYTGYGAVNVFSSQQALAVLAGTQEMPTREQADTFYEADQDVREAYYPPTTDPGEP